MIGARQTSQQDYGAFGIPYPGKEHSQIWELISLLGPQSVYSTRLYQCLMVPTARPRMMQRQGTIIEDYRTAAAECPKRAEAEIAEQEVDLWLGIGIEVTLWLFRRFRGSLLRSVDVEASDLWSSQTVRIHEFRPSISGTTPIVTVPSPRMAKDWTESVSREVLAMTRQE